MKATLIYDNTAFRSDLQADWGFAALIEAHGRRMLFDTGARGAILLTNMARLGIDPASIDDLFISHAHFDHTGGVSAFLDRNDAATVWVPRSFRGVRNAGAVVSVDEARTLYEGIHSTGELAGIEQSLCIDTPGGIVIVAGCSHPPLPQIVAAASRFGRVCGIVGGLHGNRADTLQGLAWICATHCTRHREAIKSRYPERCIEGGAGRVILIEDGAPSPL